MNSLDSGCTITMKNMEIPIGKSNKFTILLDYSTLLYLTIQCEAPVR